MRTLCRRSTLLAVVVMFALTVMSSAEAKVTQKPRYQYTKKPVAQVTPGVPKTPKTASSRTPVVPLPQPATDRLSPSTHAANTGPPAVGHENYTLDYNECFFNFCECCPPERGPPGPKGDQGSAAAAGDRGPPGPPGVPGAQGLRGAKGFKGDKGDRGNNGLTGTPGIPGKHGLRGDVGAKGERGGTGLQGVKGNIGEKGEPGQNGTAGEKGEPGREGPVGPQGPGQGPKGDKGERGECGILGERGLKGDRGEPGPPGMMGQMGIPGTNGKHGTPGPVGVRGDPGPFGRQGDQGVKGPQGPEGMRGLQGPKGERGYPGMRGERGFRGFKGAKGSGLQPPRSAFSVGISPRKSFPPSGFPIRFDKIFYNEENHFNLSANSFTCVHPGVYVFSFHITVRNQPLRATLVVNGSRRVRTRDSLLGQDIDQASSLVLLRLAAGDQVWMETFRDWNGAYASSEDDSIFSGFLLYSDKA